MLPNSYTNVIIHYLLSLDTNITYFFYQRTGISSPFNDTDRSILSVKII